MQNKLLQSTAKLFGGSAIASMGFSFGRDLYSTTKKNKDARGGILAVMALCLAVLGAYSGGVILARNYRSLTEGIIYRVGGVIILLPSFVFLAFLSALFTPGSSSESSPARERVTIPEAVEVRRALPVTEELSDSYASASPSPEVRRAIPVDAEPSARLPAEPEAYRDDYPSPRQNSEHHTLSSINSGHFILPSIIFLVGYLTGSSQRGKRKAIWDAESSNIKFMRAHNLYESKDSIIENRQTGQNYRIESVSTDRITLFPLGRRGKRAFILMGANGRYSDFTGMIKI